jgi:hypothetical protein
LNIEKLFYDSFLENRYDDSCCAILLNIYLNDITDPIEQREKVVHRIVRNGLKLLSITYDDKQECIVLNKDQTNGPFKNFIETLYSSTKKILEDEDMQHKAFLKQEALEKKSAKVKKMYKKIYIILGVLTLCGLCVGGYVNRKKLISKRFTSDKITKIKSVI